MPHVEASVAVAASPEVAFAAIDFFGDSAWIPGTTRCEFEGQGVGTVRTVVTASGICIKERLEAHDVAARRYSYEIIEAPMPVSNYHSSVQVSEEGHGSRITWQASFEAPADSEEAIRSGLEGLFHGAMAGLLTRLGPQGDISRCPMFAR